MKWWEEPDIEPMVLRKMHGVVDARPRLNNPCMNYIEPHILLTWYATCAQAKKMSA